MPAIVSRRLPGLTLAMLGIALLGMPALGAAPPAPGQSAPPLVGRTFSGAPIDLATFRGRVVVLNFWASWCVPCRAEMPELEALYRDRQDQGVTVIGLSADDRHDRAAAVKAAGAVSYPVGLLSEASVNGFGSPQVLPLTYIIDATGKVSAVLSANRGPISAQQLRSAVSAAAGS
ncbi:MAG TPA: TlpA disulfide reductase family protein [Steroidobacteraceae bacterium]|nr:TlpA disulfide reductase family protein [Steroidobacteraceae bacterium]